MTTAKPLTMAAAATALLILGSTQGHAQQSSTTGAPQATKPGGSDATQGAMAAGTVQKVDVANRILGLAHGPIPAIGWPAMTMEFPVAAGVDLSGLTPGRQVDFTLAPRPGASGGYIVTHVAPKG